MSVSPADLITLSALLDEALDLAPEDTERWLDDLDARHDHLRSQLREMLAGRRSDAVGRFLADGPRVPGAFTADCDAAAGAEVGPYRLLRQIGRGGMGTVWLAERIDGHPRRQVALKLPRLTWDESLGARMRRERDIGALLEHPHIARLYDAGVDASGRPFLAFEYIAGEPLDVWCRTRAPSVRQRLELFIQVIRAVSHAHARLVIHRDIKPSNVMVTADGQAHLLDFGIGKLLLDTAVDDQLTRDVGQVLSPGYAAPEQLRGEPLTVAADVYSLGAVLFEVLAGTSLHPARRGAVAVVDLAMRDIEPACVSRRVADKAVARVLRGELDAIVAKALRHEPAERYASADAFADEIQRYLDGERVLARPDRFVDRCRRVLRRHALEAGAASLVVVAVAVGSVIAVVQAQRATTEADRARLVKQFVSTSSTRERAPTCRSARCPRANCSAVERV